MLPSLRLIILVMAAAPLFLAGTLYEGATAVGVLYLMLLAFYTSLDALLLPRKKRIVVGRNVAERVSVGYPTALSLTVENRTRRRMEVETAHDCPEELEVSPDRTRAVITPGGTVTFDLRLTAHQRGEHQLGRVFVRALPALGLLYRQFTVDLPTQVQVFPNLMNVRRTELLARRGSSYEQGLARLRSIGQGFEFESLRKYVQGDELSRIEWKVTARRADLIVKNFEPERQQSILIALDVGRATAGEFGGLSRVDYLVNATLMLAFIALRQRDQFSMVAFSDRIESYLPPVSGLKGLERVARALYRLHAAADGRIRLRGRVPIPGPEESQTQPSVHDDRRGRPPGQRRADRVHGPIRSLPPAAGGDSVQPGNPRCGAPAAGRVRGPVRQGGRAGRAGREGGGPDLHAA